MKNRSRIPYIHNIVKQFTGESMFRQNPKQILKKSLKIESLAKKYVVVPQLVQAIQLNLKKYLKI